MPSHFNLKSLTLFAAVLFFASCQKSENELQVLSTGQLQIEITDAPIDNHEVRHAFITISGISLGDSNLLTEKTTIDLLAYQKGNTKLMGVYNLEAKVYDYLTITLDLQEDAFGNIPGCYVSTMQGKKHNLYPSTNLSKKLSLIIDDLEILPNQQSNLLLDFDLRKLIRYGKDASSVKYQFVDDRDMEDGIRVLCKDKTGHIRGNFNRDRLADYKIVAFIYKTGTFSHTREIRSSETSIPNFFTAVNSSEVTDQGEFYLPFLLKGSYELIFAAMDKTGDGALVGILNASSAAGSDLYTIHVEPGNELKLQGTIHPLEPN